MNIFNKKHPIKQGMYAVTRGDYMGEFFIFLFEEVKIPGMYTIFSLPDKKIKYISEEDITEGFKQGILDFVKKIPKAYYNVCLAEFRETREHEEKEKEIKDERARDESNN